MKAIRVRLWISIMILASTCSLFSSWSQAEDKKDEAKKVSGDKKRADINFEDELVEGEYKKPELFYLLQKKQFNYKRLIKLRENFLPEMRRDAEEMRQGRSKN